MKKILYFFIFLTILKMNGEIKANGLTPADKFYISPDKIISLEEEAFSGDSMAANKLAEYYYFSSQSVSDRKYGDIWLYISGLLGNKKACANLQELLRQKKINNIHYLILSFSDAINNLEQNENNFSFFVLCRYFYEIGQNNKAEKYFNKLKSNKVDSRLLDISNNCLIDTFVIQQNNIKTAGDKIEMNLNIDEQTAIKLAEVILVKIYGEKVLEQKPWKITQNGNFYKIEGTFLPENSDGGVAEIVISKSDARVLKYTNGK